MKLLCSIKYFLFLSILCCFNSNNLFAQIEFVQNKGQWNKNAQYKADFKTGVFFLEKNGFTVLLNNPSDLLGLSQKKHGFRNPKTTLPPTKDDDILHSFAYKVNFIGANELVEAIPDKPLPTYNNYFLGNDKTKWAGDCKIYNAITYKNIYPNIDIRYYSTKGQLKYDFIVHSGGNPLKIIMKYEGGVKLSLKNKELNIFTAAGTVTELEPYSYQTNVSDKKNIVSSYIVEDNIVSFKISDYNPSTTLIVDPTLIFSTFTGSASDDWGYSATPGPDGSFFAGGAAFSQGYPVTLGAFQTTYAGTNPPGSYTGYDISISKFSADGTTRIFATYIGGSNEEQPHSLIADAAGNLIIAGRSNSPNYPTLTNVPNTGSGYDIIITKLNATGTALLGSVKIGGSGDDGVNIRDKEDPVGFGDNSIRRNYGDDARSEVILDAANNVILASCTQSSDFPILNAFQPVFGGGLQDGIILKFNANLSSLIFATYFGGTANDACFVASFSPITNNLYIGGATESNDIPGDKNGTLNANFLGLIDGYITELSPNGLSIIKTTFIGTTNKDAVYGLKFDKYGYPYIMGTTDGTWIPFNATYNVPGSHQYIAKLKPDLSAFVYSTNFGTNSTTPNISPIAFLVDRCENVYVSGWGGGINSLLGFPNAGTSGLPQVNPLTTITLPPPDGSDFYFFVLKKDAQAQLFGSYFGQNGGSGDHVDGGTSRFDANGIIYQAMCANCVSFGAAAFPIYPSNAAATINPSQNCNLAAVKINMNFAGVVTEVQSSIEGILNDTLGCIPVLINFKDTLQKGVTYYWNFNVLANPNGVDTITTQPTASHFFTQLGTFRVRLISEDSSTCNIRDTAYKTVTISDRVVTAKFNTEKLTLCSATNNQFRFTNISTNTYNSAFQSTSFEWDYGDGSPKDTANLLPPRLHTYATQGTYVVKLRAIDNRFCNAPVLVTDTIRLNGIVKAKSAIVATGCSQNGLTLPNLSQGGISFLWQLYDGNTNLLISTSTAFQPFFTFPAEGPYYYRVIAYDSNTCNKIDTSVFYNINVIKTPIPLFSYTPNPPQPNTAYQFFNQSLFANRYLWDFGDGTTSTAFAPSHLYEKRGNYKVTLHAYNSQCEDSVSQTVTALINPLLDVPNAFTPDKFGQNAIVYVRGFGIEKIVWKIYNRWGELVFESNDPKQGWDGYYKGKLLPMDVYTYTLEAEFVDGQKASRTGDISLLR